MIEALDGVVSRAPFIARRRILFSDCDAAGVVFAGNYYRYALWAYDLFHDHYLKPVKGAISMPVKAASIIHTAPLRPGEDIDLSVDVADIGGKTFSVAILGRSGGKQIFQSTLTLICKPDGEWISCVVPTAMRDVLAKLSSSSQQTLTNEGI